jgi:hypothetical protein
MNKITVNKAELLAVLQHNREQHRKLFEDALKGWHEACLSELERLLQLSRENKVDQNLMVNLPRPTDHTTDYNRVIGMLEMHVGDEIEIDDAEYAQFVQDDWGWRGRWLLSNSAYSNEVAAASRLVQ